MTVGRWYQLGWQEWALHPGHDGASINTRDGHYGNCGSYWRLRSCNDQQLRRVINLLDELSWNIHSYRQYTIIATTMGNIYWLDRFLGSKKPSLDPWSLSWWAKPSNLMTWSMDAAGAWPENEVICLQEVDENWAGRLHQHFQSDWAQ